MKVVFVEVGGSHDECLHSQIDFIKNEGGNISIITTSEQHSRLKKIYPEESITIIDFKNKNKFKRILLVIKLRKLIINSQPDYVLFNTAEGNIIKYLSFYSFPSKIKFRGIQHTIKKVGKSGSQKFISRLVDKYFVLGDYLLDQIPKKHRDKFQTIYPIILPKVEINNTVNKAKNEVWFCIPGSVEFNRRDYLSLIDVLKKNNIPKNYKFILLGRTDLKTEDCDTLLSEIEKHKLQDYFISFKGFIPEDHFQEYLELSDFILPLISSKNPTYRKFLHEQISGSFSLAFASKKTMLIDQFFSAYTEFIDSSLFYTEDSFESVILNSLAEKEKKQFYQLNMWNYNHQKSQYLNHLTKP